jgi:hypothetical protein
MMETAVGGAFMGHVEASTMRQQNPWGVIRGENGAGLGDRVGIREPDPSATLGLASGLQCRSLYVLSANLYVSKSLLVIVMFFFQRISLQTKNLPRTLKHWFLLTALAKWAQNWAWKGTKQGSHYTAESGPAGLGQDSASLWSPQMALCLSPDHKSKRVSVTWAYLWFN